MKSGSNVSLLLPRPTNLSYMEHTTVFWMAIGFICSIVFNSFFEWTLHKYVMHRPVGNFDYAFKAHAVVHHQTFKADHTYHDNPQHSQAHLIPMAWWNGPVLVALCILPFFLISWATGNWPLCWGASICATGYFVTYEYLHYCMHQPRKRSIERSGIFFRLNGHHILHHRYMHKNFNVVLPLADTIMGTLILRSKVSFAQVRGPAVPDLQPLQERRRWVKSSLRFMGQVIKGVKTSES
jgi:hypothetical protein